GYGSSTYSFATYVNVDPTSALTLGTEVTGTLVNPGDEATYTFTGSPGQQIYFDGRESGGSSIYAALTDPFGTQVFNQAMAYDDGPYTLTQAGTYTLTVSGSGSATGAYDFVLDDTSAAPTIATNTVVSATVPTGFSTNLYQISGTAGERLYIQAQSITDSSSNPDPNYYLGLALYGPNSQQIASPYNFNDFTATLPADGTYTLAVYGTGYTTSSIDYSFEAFQTVTSTTPMTLGTEEIGALANPGDQALYTFTGSPGQQIYFDGRESGGSSIYAALTGPSGTQVFYQSMAYDDGPYTLTQAGTYTLTVNGSGATTGAYDFVLNDTSAAPTIATNTPVSDTVPTGFSTNLYQISGTAGEQIYFQAQSITDSSSNPDPSNYLDWALYGPNSQQIASPYYYGFNDFTATLPADGTYVLAVVGEGYTTSSIDYSFEAFQTVTSTTPMTLGTEEMGTLANPGDQALYTFTGSSGQNIFFDGLSADSGINASLTNPSGNQIFNVAAGSDAGPYTLSEPGTYTLTIAGGGNTGNFDFRMLDSSAQALAPSSTPTTVSDPNLPGTGTDIYQLMGTAGEQLTLTSDSFSSNSGTWYIVDPNNNQIASAPFGSSFSNPVTLGLTGPYEIVLAGSDTTDPTISYSFDISATFPDETVIPSGFGTEQSGSLDSGASTTFTFMAPAGLSIYLNSLGFSVPMDANLTDPNSNTVFDYDPSTGNAGPYVLSVSGTYTLTLTNNSGSPGTYDFNMLDMTDSPTALTLGAVTSGALAPGNSVAVYSFTGTAGQNLFLDNKQNPGAPVNLFVYDPYNNQIAYPNQGFDPCQ